MAVTISPVFIDWFLVSNFISSFQKAWSIVVESNCSFFVFFIIFIYQKGTSDN